jgi:signal transduction histidine kinase
MRSAQTDEQQAEKSKGESDAAAGSARIVAASGRHAADRIESGFDLMAMMAEYRALRASVIRLWHKDGPEPDRRDLDDVTRFNESIDQSVTEAVRAYTARVSRGRQMFLAILGHDLRNPLGAMKLTGEALARSGQLDPELNQMASGISVSAAAMGKLIDDLLDFTGAELSGGLPITPGPMDLAKLCREVIDETRAANPSCQVRLDSRGDLTGAWDARRLRQVVSNLLGNAAQHGKADCQIDVSVTGEAKGVTLAVHNQGPPIPRESLPTIFEPMVRGGQARERRGSIGLGLYITRAIVVGHGGTIEVASSAEAGTTFTVRLPRQQSTR